MKSKNRRLTIRINRDAWRVHILSDGEYCKQTGETIDSSLGVTKYNHQAAERDIYLRRKHATFDTIMHEVLHAYFSYRDFSKKGYGTIEEEVCEYLPRRIKSVLRNVAKIRASLRKRS